MNNKKILTILAITWITAILLILRNEVQIQNKVADSKEIMNLLDNQ